MTLDELMGLPWTWIGPRRVVDPDEGEYFELRVAELPDFYVAESTAMEARQEANPALRAFLASYTDAGEDPPVPTPSPFWQWLVRVVPLRRPETQPARPVATTHRLGQFHGA